MSDDSLDPRSLFLSSLDVSSCRIEFSNTPIVLLCGGVVKFKLHPDEPDPPVESLRHAITNFRTKFEIFRPEEIQSWHSDGVFKDLISFEIELASICGLVVIILESEGALVELGAFSQLPELSNKIVAICPEKFIGATSFINLGILRFIAASNAANVKSYPWEPKQPKEPFILLPQVVEDAASDIQDELAKIPDSQLLKIDKNSHIMVLICEFLKLFSALKETEILEYLKFVGIKVTADVLKGKLFLLLQFRLIKKQQYSDAVFYLRGTEPYHKLRISTKDASKPIDTLRVEMQCLEYYNNSEKHRNRIRAIAQAGKGVSK